MWNLAKRASKAKGFQPPRSRHSCLESTYIFTFYSWRSNSQRNCHVQLLQHGRQHFYPSIVGTQKPTPLLCRLTSSLGKHVISELSALANQPINSIIQYQLRKPVRYTSISWKNYSQQTTIQYYLINKINLISLQKSSVRIFLYNTLIPQLRFSLIVASEQKMVLQLPPNNHFRDPDSPRLRF